MKLIYCPHCSDVVRLIELRRYCDCSRSYGNYVDRLQAEIGGLAIPIGISNPSFKEALDKRPAEGLGESFEAFVIPVKCDTIKNL